MNVNPEPLPTSDTEAAAAEGADSPVAKPAPRRRAARAVESAAPLVAAGVDAAEPDAGEPAAAEVVEAPVKPKRRRAAPADRKSVV